MNMIHAFNAVTEQYIEERARRDAFLHAVEQADLRLLALDRRRVALLMDALQGDDEPACYQPSGNVLPDGFYAEATR